MFERLFTYHRVLLRHLAAPWVRERRRFLHHRELQGTPRSTLLRYARELRIVACRLDLSGGRRVAAQEIDAAARRWAQQQRRRVRTLKGEGSARLFVQAATAWLGFLDRLATSPHPPPPFAVQAEEWSAFLRDSERLRTATVANYGWWIRRFLAWLEARSAPLNRVQMAQVDAFLQDLASQGLSRSSLATAAKSLRRFFPFAWRRGWCRRDLAPAILSPRLFRYEDLPAGPAWADVQRLIAHTSGGGRQDLRTHAMLRLLAVYGLRSGEVRGLLVEDIDWRRKVLRVRRGKSTRVQNYPLTSATLQALRRYWREARPTSARPEFFLSLHAPFRPLSAGALHHVIQALFQRWQVPSPKRGPHALRHACATHLLGEGLSLKEIGDHLGHQHTASTRLYAKVDALALRAVANWDLGGVR